MEESSASAGAIEENLKNPAENNETQAFLSAEPSCNSLEIGDALFEAEQTVPLASEVREEGEKREGTKKNLQLQVQQEEFDALMRKIAAEENVDEKLRHAIDSMEIYLSQGGTPLFKYFWELRKLCLGFFKEAITPSARATLWPRYSHLSKEARRLKEIFDEQSAYAVEQIDMAVSALESEIHHFEEAAAAQSNIDFPFKSKFFDKKKEFYIDIQKQLNLLNAHATRINNLRKELMKTDMRIKHKNKFFQRLSVAGDKVFPVRKELIKKISDRFLTDVESFLIANFSGDQTSAPVFYLREEIKALQSIAKTLTLNTHSFTSTRLRLSESWDKLKVVDKERKKEFAEKKDIFLQNRAEVETKIEALSKKFKEGELSTGAALKEVDAVQVFMRQAELGRDEVKFLKNALAEVRDLIEGQKNAEEEARLNEEREKVRLKRERLTTVKQEIDDILAGSDQLSAEAINAKQNELIEKVAQLKEVTGRERQELERSLRQLKDIYNAKQEEALLSLSDDDQQALKNLRDVLDQRRSRRKTMKERYDTLRKASGSSGRNIEQALLHDAQVNEEKMRLEQADGGIEEIERKIKDIKSKIK